MSTQTIEQRAKNILLNDLGVEESQLTPNARFVEDLGMDSLDTMELLMSAEEEFGINIPDEEAAKLLTVGGAIEYIQSKLA